MVNTRYLTTVVEEHVRAALADMYGVAFEKRVLPLVTGGTHEFDAVSTNGRHVISIKSAAGKTAGGKNPSGKIQGAIAELYFLSLVDAPRELLLTSREFHNLFVRMTMNKVAPGIEIVHHPLPPEIQAEVDKVQRAASIEVFPVMDAAEADVVEADLP